MERALMEVVKITITVQVLLIVVAVVTIQRANVFVYN